VADDEHALVLPRGNRLAPEVQRCRGGRARVLDVDDRNPGQAEPAEDDLRTYGLLPVHQPADCVADEGSLDVAGAQPGVVEPAPNCLLDQAPGCAVEVLAEPRHRSPANLDGTAHRYRARVLRAAATARIVWSACGPIADSTGCVTPASTSPSRPSSTSFA